jgi:predicted MFS family arabinose efflux permease
MIRSRSNSISASVPALLAVGTFALGIDSFVLAGLLPALARDLHVSLAQAGQLTTAFAITYALGSPLIATVTGRLDRRAVLGGGMAVFLAGMVGQALGPSYVVVLAGRILSALGAAGFQASAYAVVGALSPPERRARSLALVGAGSSLATVVGVPVGVLVGQQVGWRATLWMIACVAAIAAALCLALPAVSIPSASLRERFGILADPGMVTLLGGTALQLLPLYAVFAYVAPILGAQGQTATPVLAALIAFGVAFFTGNRLVGRLTERWGGLRAAALGLSVSTLALLALWAARPHIVLSVIALAVLGLAGPFQVTPQQTRILAASGPAATVALGLNGSMIYVGTGGGAALGGAALSLAGVSWVPVLAIVLALVALAFLLVTAPERASGPGGADGRGSSPGPGRPAAR